MRYLSFSFAALVTGLLFFFLNGSIQTGKQSIPPPGSFFSPYTGFWRNAEPLQPAMSAISLDIPELSSDVSVFLDDRLVPHIYTENMESALFAQGYLHARYRLWQLDISTRAAGGRLAEVLGPVALGNDRKKRHLGFRLAAANAVNHWKNHSEETVRFFQAYSRGVNSYLRNLKPRDYPLEFKLLNYAPEPWTMEKSALFRQAMIETLCIREFDLEETNALHLFGEELFHNLFPFYNTRQKPIIPEDTPWDFTPVSFPQEQPESYLGTIEHEPFPKPPPHLGSNNWAVAGSKSATGFPILCNDPHLNLTLPPIWYETHLHTAKANAYGASLPGVPGIMIGFNDHVAWGVTNVGQDVLDWYRIHWADSSRNTYWLEGQQLPVEKVVEVIKVKGQKAVVDTVRYTNWGPVVYEEEGHPRHDMAMQWTGLMQPEPHEALVFVHLNQATNYSDFQKAVASHSSPPQNFVFASKDGDIAMQIGGRIPIRSRNQGRFILEGDRQANDWKGFIPFAHLPAERNPERGFVSSANQHSTGPDYPYSYYGHFDDYRGRRLFDRLQAMEGADFNEMQELQNDNFSVLAQEATPLLLSYLDRNKIQPDHPFLPILKDWDYRFEKESLAPAIFNHWFNHFYALMWDEMEQNEEQLAVRVPEKWRTVEILDQEPEHPFFDRLGTEQIETAFDVVTLAFQKADSVLQATFNYQKQGLPTWEEDKDTYIPHLGLIAAFNREHLPIGGYAEALNSVKKKNGPSWRMIVELGAENKGYGVYPGGQSGNPGSPYYDNFIQHWAEGKYFPLSLSGTVENPGFSPLLEIHFKKNE